MPSVVTLLAVFLLSGCASPLARMPRQGSGTQPGLTGQYCVTPLPTSWQDALAAGPGVTTPKTESVFAAAPAGGTYFAAFYSATWSGVAELSIASGAVRRIATFADPSQDQIGFGAFGGQWLAWEESLSPSNYDSWVIWAWNASTGALAEVASSAALGSSLAAQTPQPEIALSGDEIAWVQNGPSGIPEIMLHNLATKSTAIAAQGAVGPPTFWESTLLYPSLQRGQTYNELKAVSIQSLAPAAVPVGLSAARGLGMLSASVAAVVWTGTDQTSVWYWQPGLRHPFEIYTGSNGFAEFYSMAGPYVVWDTSSGPIVADTETRSLVNLGSQYGYAVAAGSWILIAGDAVNQQKTMHPLETISAIDIAAVSALAAC